MCISLIKQSLSGYRRRSRRSRRRRRRDRDMLTIPTFCKTMYGTHKLVFYTRTVISVEPMGDLF